MSFLHDLILRNGPQLARKQASLSDRRFVDVSAAAMAEADDSACVTHSAWCWASFPRRHVGDGQRWISHGPRYSLIVEPGVRIVDGTPQPDGVPYGSRTRLIMFYVQTCAANFKTTEIPLCHTLNSCMQEMGLAVGGHSYELVREQIRRFLGCRISLYDNRPDRPNSARSGGQNLLIKDFHSASATTLNEATVSLGKEYVAALRTNAVQYWQPALKFLANQSLSIDAYLWLAFLLPRLQEPTTASWPTLHRQFGSSYKNLFQFKPRFTSAVKMAMAVYPAADVEFDLPNGIILRPSGSPVAACGDGKARQPAPHSACGGAEQPIEG
jgi:hypothetical protein